MGEEADADWEAGLIEWGQEFADEDIKDRYRQILGRAARTSPFRNRRKRRHIQRTPQETAGE